MEKNEKEAERKKKKEEEQCRWEKNIFFKILDKFVSGRKERKVYCETMIWKLGAI